MIIVLLGGIGEGKSLSIVREMINNSQQCFTNFDVKAKFSKRIKLSDIIITSDKLKDWSVNWKYWEEIRKKHKSFSIYLDEVHNIIHSRSSMSKRNTLMSVWVSQIRKILSDSMDNHLYIISQTLSKIDKDFRDLAHFYIVCRKLEVGKNVYIVNYHYKSADAMMMQKASLKTYFLGNPYFKYYDSKKIVKFTDAEEYI